MYLCVAGLVKRYLRARYRYMHHLIYEVWLLEFNSVTGS